MIADIAVILFSLMVAGLFNSEMDSIMLKRKDPFFTGGFWLTKNYMRIKYPRLDWWFKYPLSFISDGWHLCKSSMVTAFLIIGIYFFCRLYGLGLEWFIAGIFAGYIWYGVIFNFGYDY